MRQKGIIRCRRWVKSTRMLRR
ncbi:hypothetical protein PSPO01_10801 [Paraphaeosphaeria sporulosa]